MIKAILFDFDGVLTFDAGGSIQTCEYIAEKTGIDLSLLYHSHKKFMNDLNLGIKTYKDIWDEFCTLVGEDIDFSILQDSFKAARLDAKMIGIAEKLKEKYKIGMITDNKIDRIEAVLSSSDLKNLFDIVVISAEVGSKKSDDRIFEVALDKLDLKAEECVFIDNNDYNLTVPSKMGMKTILFDDERRNMGQIEELL